MIGQKTKSGLAIVIAVLAGFLLLGLTYLIFPNLQGFQVIGKTGTSQTPTPIPIPNATTQIVSAFYWMGLGAVSAIAITGSIVAINWARRKKVTLVKIGSRSRF